MPAVALVALPLVGSFSTWVTLTLAGLAMGMIIFIIASGLTLVFGLMDVLNFGHGAFISIGAYAAAVLVPSLAGFLHADSLLYNLVALLALIAVAMAVTGLLGYAFERIIIMPVYGQHLKQILVTVGGLIVAEQILVAIFGPVQIALTLPTAFRGALVFGDVAIERYRLIAVVVGLVGFCRHAPGAQPHPHRSSDPRRRRERRNGRGARLSHPPPVRRRVHGGFGARRAWAA